MCCCLMAYACDNFGSSLCSQLRESTAGLQIRATTKHTMFAVATPPPGTSSGPESEVHDVRLSKYLSRLLRHKALESGVQVDTEGWARVSDALRWANGMEVNAVVHRMEDASNAVNWSEVRFSAPALVQHMLRPV